jgi:hypothetical protein
MSCSSAHPLLPLWGRYLLDPICEGGIDPAQRFASREWARQLNDPPQMRSGVAEALSDPDLRHQLIARVLQGRPNDLPRAVRVLGELSSPLEIEFRERVSDPRVRDAIAERAAGLPPNYLVAFLKWAYGFAPVLAETVERAIHGEVRRKLISALVDLPHTLRGFEKRSDIVPLLGDLAKAAREKTVELSPTGRRNSPRGFPFQVASLLERDPALAPVIGLDKSLSFIEFPHRARRRKIAAEAAVRSLRAAENLDQVVEEAFEFGPDPLCRVLRWSAKHAPEIKASLCVRLQVEDELEALITASIAKEGLGGIAKILRTLSQTEPSLKDQAVSLLTCDRQLRQLVPKGFPGTPADWVGVLRDREVAGPLLSSVDRGWWREFWCSYPPEMPDWAKVLRQALRAANCPELEVAPAEYILLGTGPDQWHLRHVTLRNLSNALSCRANFGDQVVMGFLNRMEHRAFLDKRFAAESNWALAHFIYSIGAEHSRSVFKATLTQALNARLEAEMEVSWDSHSVSGAAGLIALVGALTLSEVTPHYQVSPLPAALIIEVLSFLGGPGQSPSSGDGLVFAGLRSLCAG